MHRLGFAFSVETWENSQLVGGLYGIRLGRVLFGESMFHLRTDASKLALAALLELMRQDGMLMLDCQQTTPHMLGFGAREIPRREFLALLERGVADSHSGRQAEFRPSRRIIPPDNPAGYPAGHPERNPVNKEKER
jgi:leucyl/phenylalanyl-tRNA--protein transferase